MWYIVYHITHSLYSFKDYSQMADKSYVVVRSTRDIKEGEELTINYGHFDNVNLFTRFGFMYPDNPHDYIEIELDQDKLEEYASILYHLKLKILKTGPDMDFDKIKIYGNRFQKNYLTS